MATTIIGYAAVFYDGTRDTEFELLPGVFERIGRGAFDTALLDNFGYDTVAAVNHDPNLPLGRRGADVSSLILTSDNRGLKYEIHTTDTTIARDAVKNIRAKIIKGSSFAFSINDEQWHKDGSRDIRTILDVMLLDVAPVVFPAYRATELPTNSVSVKERSIADDARAVARLKYAQRATVVAREQHKDRQMILANGPLQGRLVEHANVRRDGQREQLFTQSKRLIMARFEKLQAELRDTSTPQGRRVAIAGEMAGLQRRKAGLDSVLAKGGELRGNGGDADPRRSG